MYARSQSHTHTHTHTHIHTCSHTRMQKHTLAHTLTNTHADTHTYLLDLYTFLICCLLQYHKLSQHRVKLSVNLKHLLVRLITSLIIRHFIVLMLLLVFNVKCYYCYSTCRHSSEWRRLWCSSATAAESQSKLASQSTRFWESTTAVTRGGTQGSSHEPQSWTR